MGREGNTALACPAHVILINGVVSLFLDLSEFSSSAAVASCTGQADRCGVARALMCPVREGCHVSGVSLLASPIDLGGGEDKPATGGLQHMQGDELK